MSIVVDGDFPGGNIHVESVGETTVRLRQQLRDTSGHWFYWYFRVRGAAGKTVTFQFTDGDVMGVTGPAYSVDDGLTWDWLGASTTAANSFNYTFGPNAHDVRFSVGLPYVQQHWERWRVQGADKLPATDLVLCTTPQGRTTELLHISPSDTVKARLLLTARHHACEAVANYVLEGILDSIATEPGNWLRRHADVLAVPFVDKDGVENGDQGKNRQPRDHNRDYGTAPLYSSVRALQHIIADKPHLPLVAIDLHCPYLKGGNHQHIHFVGSDDPAMWHEQKVFSSILEETCTGPLPYEAAGNLPYGQGWNKGDTYVQGLTFAKWASMNEFTLLSTTMEIPYAVAGHVPVTVQNARLLGHDVARALQQYMTVPRA